MWIDQLVNDENKWYDIARKIWPDIMGISEYIWKE